MTQEDEEFMLDNFVTFFIAGEAAGLGFVSGSLQIAWRKVQFCSLLIDFVNCNISGQETTANQLAFCIMELARHPDIMER